MDGRWDLLLQPWGAEARQEYQGFGVIECYENASPQADEPAYLKHPEDIAHVIRMWNPTAVSLKLDRGERVSVGEIVEAYRELEPGPLGMVMPSPESDSMTARMVAEAKVRALLVESEQ